MIDTLLLCAAVFAGSGAAAWYGYRVGYRDGRQRGYRLGLEHGAAGYTIAARYPHGHHAHVVWRPPARTPEGR